MRRRRKLNRTQVIPFTPKRAKAAKVPSTRSSDTEYQVGPGHPPKEYQFKPGQSGNPEGTRKESLIADILRLLERALKKKIKPRRGEFTKAAAGIDKLANQFAKGDRHARKDLKDLIVTLEKLRADPAAGRAKPIANASTDSLTEQDRELLADYVRRHAGEHHRGDAKIVQPFQTGTPKKTSCPTQGKQIVILTFSA